MGEASRRAKTGPALTADGRFKPGWVGIALVVPGGASAVIAFEADRLDRLMDETGAGMKMPPAARDDPAVYAALWRAVLDLARNLGRGGSSNAHKRLGRHALWLALNTPGGEIRRQFEGLLRDGLVSHVTVTAADDGLWRCAVGPRFDGEAEMAARAMVALDAAAEGPAMH